MHHIVQCSVRLSVRLIFVFLRVVFLPNLDNSLRVHPVCVTSVALLQTRAPTRLGHVDLCVPVRVRRCIPIGRFCQSVWMLRPECVRHHHTRVHGRSSSGTALFNDSFTSSFCQGNDSHNQCTHTVDCTTDKYFQGFLTNDASRLVQITSVPRLASSTLCSTPANGIEPETSQQCVRALACFSDACTWS
jgi:hypothetical protein